MSTKTDKWGYTNYGYPDWYFTNKDQRREYYEKRERDDRSKYEQELRIARGERRFADGFNGGTWDD